MSGYLETHRTARGFTLLIRRYFDHHVARDSAALSYYLLFALFPLLIFLNNLVGLLSFDFNALLAELGAVIPREVLELVRQYLGYISRVSSTTLMWFSLVFTIYFPYRAVNALFMSVRKAYDAGMPVQFLRYRLRGRRRILQQRRKTPTAQRRHQACRTRGTNDFLHKNTS